ncbi:MAG TPA: hypothetical protein V6D23_10965 [Candidatus Obscuribacterales bacterium]
MVTVILANLRRIVQHRSLLGLLLILITIWPAAAQEEGPGPVQAPAQTQIHSEDEPEYVAGQVTEIISETSIQDEAFGREEKKFRFKVHFPGKGNDPEETILLEQSYSPETSHELLPVKGKRFIFYKETMADGTHAFTLIDVQRLNHVPWVALAVIVLLVLLGRWYGIKALLISCGLLACFLLFQLLKFPWLLNSLLTFAAVGAFSCLLTFGTGPRFVASFASTLLGGGVILALVWLSGVLAISSPSVLLGSGMVLQMAAGLSYISISTVTAVHLSWRNDPNLSPPALFQKGYTGGRGSIEVVATLYLVIAIGQILTTIYSQGGEPGLLQMEPILTEMASLLFMLLGFALALPLSAMIGSRLLPRR